MEGSDVRNACVKNRRPKEIVYRIDLEDIHCPVCVVSLEAVLAPFPRKDARKKGHMRVLKGTVDDPVWISPADRDLLEWISTKTEVILSTHLRSIDLMRANIPVHGPLIVAGGFTIQDRCGRSDQEWRRIQAGRVRGDEERLQDLSEDLHVEFGGPAYRTSILEQDGLPYALFLPKSMPRKDEIMAYCQQHDLMRGFTSCNTSFGTVLRRKSITIKSATDFLVSRRDDQMQRAIVTIVMRQGAKPNFSASVKRAFHRARLSFDQPHAEIVEELDSKISRIASSRCL